MTRFDQPDCCPSNQAVAISRALAPSNSEYMSYQPARQEDSNAEEISKMMCGFEINRENESQDRDKPKSALCPKEEGLAALAGESIMNDGRIDQATFDLVAMTYQTDKEKCNAFINAINSHIPDKSPQLYLASRPTFQGKQTCLELGINTLRSRPTVSNRWPLETAVQQRNGSTQIVNHDFVNSPKFGSAQPSKKPDFKPSAPMWLPFSELVP